MQVDALVVLPLDAQAGDRVDGVSLRVADRSLHRRLELFTQVQHHVGRADPVDRARGKLEVVRLGAGRSQVRHVDVGAADALGRERERVEGRDDVRAAALASTSAAVSAAAGCEEPEPDNDDSENNSRNDAQNAIMP